MADGHGHAPGLQAAHGAERDEDLELALKLHRELNAVPRRQRAPPRTQAAAAALKTLTKKHQPEQEDSGISSSSESETEGRYKGGPPSDNDSGSKRKRHGGGTATKPGQRRRSGGSGARKPQHVAAAEEARTKAGRKRGAEEPPRTHVKCFYAGLQHGAWVAAEALASRASLAAAVSRAFREDGVSCSSDAATVVFVGPQRREQEFKAAGVARQAGEQQQGNSEGWEAAARSAVRVYVR